MKGAVLDAQPCGLSICKFRETNPSQLVINKRRTDIGMNEAFTQQSGSQSKGPSPLTKMWCGLKIATTKSRGRAADIFSLGCVLVKMHVVLVRKSPADFEDFRVQDGDTAAFHLTLLRLLQCMLKLHDKVESEFEAAGSFRDTCEHMTRLDN